MSVGALITNEAGRTLVVKPSYRDYWIFVGGAVDEGERPEHALAREIAEETGLVLRVGPLLVLDWSPPLLPDRPWPMVNMLFDCGTVPTDTPITLPDGELVDHRFTEPEEAAELLSVRSGPRLRAALEHRRETGAVYLPMKTEDRHR
ncbi:NUDIX domain-containing protein [Glycomyces salinus]|uniref:NUDIX domain-containing protein n=1 Tax=Glycomyces salinus TaxID=980294 RepID=UPI0018EAC102|nr:NUDIX hydrolase [Glycomyces salinus]